MQPEPCPNTGCPLPGGWLLWRKEIAGTWYYQGREVGNRLETAWSTDPQKVSKQAFGLVSKRGPFHLVPDTAKVEACRSCGAKIIWTRSLLGTAIPLSVKSIEWRGNERYAHSHFADCPHASEWSKQRRPEPAAAPQPDVVQESFL